MKENNLTAVDVFAELYAKLVSCENIGNFDRRLYCEAYSEQAVQFVEERAMIMPNVYAKKDFNVQAMINIAYNQGFKDCCELVYRELAQCREFAERMCGE